MKARATVKRLRFTNRVIILKYDISMNVRIRSTKSVIHTPKTLTESPDFFKRLIDSLEGYVIFTLDLKGIITSWNTGAEKILGYSEREIVGKHFSIFFTPEEIQKGIPELELKRAHKVGQPVNEGWRVKKNGEMLWATGFVFPFKNTQGTIIGFTKIMRDRTERKKLEQEKDFFIGIASHELKTPVTSLKLFADILHAQAKELKSDSLVASADIIRDQVNKLVRLMGELLDFTRLQAGEMKLVFRTFDINELIEETIGPLKTTTSHTITFSTQVKKSVHADRVRIGQVLTNLITNAIKYSPQSKNIIIEAKQKKNKVRIDIKDFGMGIPKEEQEKIFKRFFRTSDVKHKHISGLGLGLFISSEIIDKHGSSIEVKSTEGKGSTFSFELPVAIIKK